MMAWIVTAAGGEVGAVCLLTLWVVPKVPEPRTSRISKSVRYLALSTTAERAATHSNDGSLAAAGNAGLDIPRRVKQLV